MPSLLASSILVKAVVIASYASVFVDPDMKFYLLNTGMKNTTDKKRQIMTIFLEKRVFLLKIFFLNKPIIHPLFQLLISFSFVEI